MSSDAFTTYQEALDWLYNTQTFGIKLGLEPTRRLLTELDAWPAENCTVFHVAGTNGKGSVCAFLDSLLRACEERTALFTSPHLVDFCERFRVDGVPMPHETAIELLSQLRALVADWEAHPTFFEIVTAMGLAWFKRQGATALVLETGMGGRLDSTNAVEADYSFITRIDLDHQKWLGETLAEIAAEKAGIIKPGGQVFSLPQMPEVVEVLEATARKQSANLTMVTEPYAGPVGLAGSHQPLHAAMALEAILLDYGGHLVDDPTLARALAETRMDGRFQTLDREFQPTDFAGARFILDGAHNPAAARRLAQTWREIYGNEERALILFGALGDKDADEMVRELEPIASQFVPVPVSSPRALTADELSWIVRRHATGKLAPEALWQDAASSAEVLDRLIAAKLSPRILVTGSLFLVGNILAHLRGVEQPRKTAQ